jgi:hypothetical protein
VKKLDQTVLFVTFTNHVKEAKTVNDKSDKTPRLDRLEMKKSRLQLAKREPDILLQSQPQTICVTPDLGPEKNC